MEYQGVFKFQFLGLESVLHTIDVAAASSTANKTAAPDIVQINPQNNLYVGFSDYSSRSQLGIANDAYLDTRLMDPEAGSDAPPDDLTIFY